MPLWKLIGLLMLLVISLIALYCWLLQNEVDEEYITIWFGCVFLTMIDTIVRNSYSIDKKQSNDKSEKITVSAQEQDM